MEDILLESRNVVFDNASKSAELKFRYTILGNGFFKICPAQEKHSLPFQQITFRRVGVL